MVTAISIDAYEGIAMNTNVTGPPPASSDPAAGEPHAEPRVVAAEVVMPGVCEPDGLVLRTRELPAPTRGQVLVAVTATGVSMAEQSMRRGRYPGQPKFPFVPGYDLVGTVTAVGPGVDPSRVGTHVAAMTKTGGWASHALLRAVDLVDVPAELDPAEVETLIVNGVTAWQMLHRTAKVQAGEIILVHGANGGVGTTLVQLAAHAGVRVIGTAHPRHHDALRALGATPVDYDDPQLRETLRDLAPEGFDAVFDHLGGESLDLSWQLLAPRGRLVSYAIATKVKGDGSLLGPFLATIGKVVAWNLLPNGKRASFYDLWSGHLRRPAAFRARVRDDVGAVLALLAAGTLAPQVAARFPLSQATEAMTLAESRTVRGKVVLLP
jgi:NADPH:quinone reductase-like Zn-dependent oxidoreductase